MATIYATAQDIRDAAPQLAISSTTKPTETQVTSFIEQVERDLEAALTTLGYVVPVSATTSPKTFAVVQFYVTQAALALTLSARSYAVTDPDSQGAGRAQKRYDDWLRQLGSSVHPTSLPDDAVVTGSESEKDGAAILSSHTDTLTSDEFDPDDPPVTMEQVF